MKKLVVYLTPLLLIFIQACNNSESSSQISDTTKNVVTNDTTTNQPDTTQKRNITHIEASEVPSAVINEFNSKYPGVTKIKWAKTDKKGRIIYKARWQSNGKKMGAAFTEDGRFLKEKEMN